MVVLKQKFKKNAESSRFQVFMQVVSLTLHSLVSTKLKIAGFEFAFVSSTNFAHCPSKQFAKCKPEARRY